VELKSVWALRSLSWSLGVRGVKERVLLGVACRRVWEGQGGLGHLLEGVQHTGVVGKGPCCWEVWKGHGLGKGPDAALAGEGGPGSLLIRVLQVQGGGDLGGLEGVCCVCCVYVCMCVCVCVCVCL
jgi:hypothetical protein